MDHQLLPSMQRPLKMSTPPQHLHSIQLLHLLLPSILLQHLINTQLQLNLFILNLLSLFILNLLSLFMLNLPSLFILNLLNLSILNLLSLFMLNLLKMSTQLLLHLQTSTPLLLSQL